MHQRNLALQKDVKRQKKDIDRLYTEYHSLCKEYSSVLEERNDLKVKHYYTTYALCELTNGHLDFAIQLYKANELQLRIPYHKRDHIGQMVYKAFNSMKSERGDSPTEDLEAHHAALMAEQPQP
jgi:hypothetical protein